MLKVAGAFLRAEKAELLAKGITPDRLEQVLAASTYCLAYFNRLTTSITASTHCLTALLP